MTFAEGQPNNNITPRTPDQIRQELARSVLFFGFEKLITVNTPLQCRRHEQLSVRTEVPSEPREKQRVTLHLDNLVYVPSCWGPDTSPLEIRVYLDDNSDFFALGSFGSVKVMRASGLFSAEIAREFTEEDQRDLNDLLVKMQNRDTEFDHFHGSNPYRH